MITPDRRHRSSVGAIVVLAAVALTACGDPRPPIDSDDARATLDALIEAVDDGTGVSFDLADCPIDGAVRLTDQSFDLVDDAIVEAALGGDADDRLVVAGDQRLLVCARSSDGASIGLAAGPAPDAIDDLAASLAGLAGADEVPVEYDVDERAQERGGEMYEVCSTAAGDPSLDTCAVVWSDRSVVVSAVVSGAGAADVDLGAVEERFRLLIQLVVDGVAAS